MAAPDSTPSAPEMWSSRKPVRKDAPRDGRAGSERHRNRSRNRTSVPGRQAPESSRFSVAHPPVGFPPHSKALARQTHRPSRPKTLQTRQPWSAPFPTGPRPPRNAPFPWRVRSVPRSRSRSGSLSRGHRPGTTTHPRRKDDERQYKGTGPLHERLFWRAFGELNQGPQPSSRPTSPPRSPMSPTPRRPPSHRPARS